MLNTPITTLKQIKWLPNYWIKSSKTHKRLPNLNLKSYVGLIFNKGNKISIYFLYFLSLWTSILLFETHNQMMYKGFSPALSYYCLYIYQNKVSRIKFPNQKKLNYCQGSQSMDLWIISKQSYWYCVIQTVTICQWSKKVSNNDKGWQSAVSWSCSANIS